MTYVFFSRCPKEQFPVFSRVTHSCPLFSPQFPTGLSISLSFNFIPLPLLRLRQRPQLVRFSGFFRTDATHNLKSLSFLTSAPPMRLCFPNGIVLTLTSASVRFSIPSSNSFFPLISSSPRAHSRKNFCPFKLPPNHRSHQAVPEIPLNFESSFLTFPPAEFFSIVSNFLLVALRNFPQITCRAQDQAIPLFGQSDFFRARLMLSYIYDGLSPFFVL